jgi:phosphoribosylamine--glycine ligase
MWYDDDENNKLFQATIAKLKGHLQKINFKGDFDINFIINEDKIYPLEATCRFGCPSTQMQVGLHLSPWSEFLLAAAKGEPYELKYRKGYGVVVSISIPPFPYRGISKDFYISGVDILFNGKLTDEEKNNLHLEEVSLHKCNNGKGMCYTIAGSNGYIVYVTGMGKTIEEARQKAYALVDKIVIPKMFYRQDIGLDFLNRDQKLLKQWGWIK